VDDTQPVGQFSATAATWLAKLTELRTAALQTPPYKRLRDNVGSAPKNIRYGVGQGAPGSMERASVQMTHGLQLTQVRDCFEHLALQHNTHAPMVTDKEEAAHDSGPPVAPYLRNRRDEYNPVAHGATGGHVAEVEGYLTLIAQSMIAGRKVACGYIKNSSL